MPVTPFKGKRKSAPYHGASGPSSPGRMPKKHSAGKQETGPFGNGTGNVRGAPSTEDVVSRRVQVSDAQPNATADPRGN